MCSSLQEVQKISRFEDETTQLLLIRHEFIGKGMRKRDSGSLELKRRILRRLLILESTSIHSRNRKAEPKRRD